MYSRDSNPDLSCFKKNLSACRSLFIYLTGIYWGPVCSRGGYKLVNKIDIVLTSQSLPSSKLCREDLALVDSLLENRVEKTENR